MNFFKLCSIAASAFMLFFSCKKEQIIPATPSFNYFPIQKGKYIVYEVDSVYHADNDNNTDDSVYTTYYQLKEVIAETFADGEGRSAQIIRRFRRDDDSLEWNDLGVYTQVLSSQGAYRTEENISYHKLAFPISEQTSWNGNDVNTLSEEIYQYLDFHRAMTVNTLQFDSTLTVLQVDEVNFIEKIHGEEVYANHVGMIYKERDDLRKVNGLVVKGIEFRMKVKSFGVE